MEPNIFQAYKELMDAHVKNCTELRMAREKIASLERQADWLAKHCPLEGTESWEESAASWRERARQATNEI